MFSGSLTPQQRLLGELLPAARELKAKLTKPLIDPEAMSPLGRSMLPYVREENLAAVTIERGEKGGWIADIHLSNTPPGVPNTFGSSVAYPLATEAEARSSAIRLLAGLLQISDGPPPEPEHRVFVLHDIHLRLPEELMRQIAEVAAERPELRYGSQALAEQRLDEVVEAAFGQDAVTEDGFDALDRDQQIRIVSVCCIASLEGLVRYPHRQPEPVGARPWPVMPESPR